MKKHIIIDKIKPDNYLVRGVGKRAIHIGGEMIIEVARDFEMAERDFLIALAKQACARGWKKAEVVRTSWDAGGYFLNLAAAKGHSSGYRVLTSEMKISRFIARYASSSTAQHAQRLRGVFEKSHRAPKNPALRDIDPFADNLTIKQKAAVLEECRINPWYFIQLFAQVPRSAGALVDAPWARSFAVAREVQMLKDSMATSKKCREDFKNSLSDESTTDKEVSQQRPGESEVDPLGGYWWHLLNAARGIGDLKSSLAVPRGVQTDAEMPPIAAFGTERAGATGELLKKLLAQRKLLKNMTHGTEITSKEGQRKLPHRALGECEVYELVDGRGRGQHPFDQFLFTTEELGAKLSAYPNVDFLVHPEIHNDSAVGELRVEPFIETPFVLEDEDSVQIVSVKNRDASIPQPDQPGEPE